MLFPALLSEISSHDLEVAETLIGVLRFILIFIAARTLAEFLVRFELPTILGELMAGVIIGASGLHLLVPPETQVQLSAAFSDVVGGLAHIPPAEVSEIYKFGTRFYVADTMNAYELLSLLFVTASLLLKNLDFWQAPDPLEVQGISDFLLGVGLVVILLSQGLRLLSTSPNFGPLVLMVVAMAADVVRWLVVMGVILLSFAVGFTTLFKSFSTFFAFSCNSLSIFLLSFIP